MASRLICDKIELMRNNFKTQDQCTVRERNGQLIFAVNSEILLPENAPVRLTSAQLEELDYRELYRAYSPRGRKSKVDPRVLFKVVAHTDISVACYLYADEGRPYAQRTVKTGL